MEKHIKSFSQYLSQGYKLGKTFGAIDKEHTFEHVVLVGMGGSGMALDIIKTVIEKSSSSLPCLVVKDYHLPQRVSSKTLMICASYSGNTEETVSAMKDGLSKGATMIAISSGGLVGEFATSHGHHLIKIQTGIEPRAALPISLGVQLAICEGCGLIDGPVYSVLHEFEQRVVSRDQKIQFSAQQIAKELFGLFPFIYSTSGFEAVALRAQQQIQENSRLLCHSHTLPEHNHNELLGRQEGDSRIGVVRCTDPSASKKIQKRVTLTKQILKERNIPQRDIVLQGESLLHKILTGLYQVDRLSLYLSREHGVDPSGMELIERFKGEMRNS